MATETATFAAGCFWGVEHRFRRVPGVIDAEVGYTGGTVANPTYHNVCSGTTGHAEAVRLTFDPEKVSYSELLGVFWTLHDPTQVDRQGPDIGTQYRSAIFCHSDEQAVLARDSKAALESTGRLRAPVATRIEPAADFWRAEEYHQRYLEKNRGAYCP